MPLLPHARISDVHAAAIVAGLASSRAALLTGMDSAFVAQLPVSGIPAAQLLVDLHSLNDVNGLADGSTPLLVWLANARALAGPRPESLVFETALAEVEAEITGRGRPAPEPTPVPSADTARVVVQYAPADVSYAQGLFVHLKPLEKSGRLSVWSWDRVPAGSIISLEARTAIDAAHVLVALVSADYLASDELSADVPAALSRGKRVLVALARPCLLQGTPFDGMATLPRGGRALSAHPSPDEAYVEIVQAIEAAADAALRHSGQENTAPASPREPKKPTRRPATAPIRPLIGRKIDDVFRRNGVPQATFVAPDQFEEVVHCLRVLGRSLVVEGPTQAGKSTVVKKALDEPPFAGAPRRTIRCQSFNARAELEAVFREGDRLEGHVLVEDAHLLLDAQRFEPAMLRSLADVMKMLADVDEPRGKITLLGISRVRWSFAQALPDLSDRLDVVPMTVQRPELVRELVERGQAAAHVALTAAEEIVEQSLGSFRLAQEICYQLIAGAGLRAVPEALTVIDTSPDAVRAKIVEGLAAEFEAPLVKVAGADQGTTRPGACLAMLTLLAVAPDLSVPIGAAWAQYPHLEPSFRWIQEGHLERLITSDVQIASVLSYRAGALTAHDPRLRYHLQGISWSRFAQLVGPFDIQQTPGQPIGISPRTRPGSHAAGASALGAYPWTDDNGLLLHKLLLSAYDSVRAAKILLATVPVDTTGVADGAVTVFWTDALDAAAKQGKLRDLVKRVLADPLIAAYHDAIRQAARAFGWG